MKKIYMSGCGGMLGEAFYNVFKDSFQLSCSDIDVNEPWLQYLDFRDFTSYQKEVNKFQPNYLFHIGAFTDLEFCEKNIDETYLTNTISVENAVYISNELNIPQRGFLTAQKKNMMIGINLIHYVITQEANMLQKNLF